MFLFEHIFYFYFNDRLASSDESVSALLPAVIEVFFFFRCSVPEAARRRPSSCRSLFGFRFPPILLQFSPSSPPSVSPASSSRPSECIFWHRETSGGRSAARRAGGGSDREMALVQGDVVSSSYSSSCSDSCQSAITQPWRPPEGAAKLR